MTRHEHKTFVGFGFGPIQSGLFLLEAYVSGNFGRYVVAEVDPDLVAAVRAAGNGYTINVARPDGIDKMMIAGVELCNPAEAAGRRRIIEAVRESSEMATALPSVKFYDSTGPDAVAALIAGGIKKRGSHLPTLIYAAENHNHAAECLAEALGRHAPPERLADVQTLNTVIGKMSGVISDPVTIDRLNLAPLTPGLGKAVLVEEFNRILISRVRPPARRGIDVFLEKDDLLPFEEAKLYGHNAIHSLIGYLAQFRGYRTIAAAAEDEWIMQTARRAFTEESGAALLKRHAGLGDELFTAAGYQAYADDLLRRMACLYLNDLVSRVTRDPLRKLGYHDRLYGTMRLAIQAGIKPRNLAMGAAAAITMMARQRSLAAGLPQALVEEALAGPGNLANLLGEIWGAERGDQAQPLVDLTWEALQALAAYEEF
ncbi:MAG: hypothetical protein LLG01_17810 [Planctomycetaceae bacterium]|nr:hypothetical protein [Planctomycetaceae bacterium]